MFGDAPSPCSLCLVTLRPRAHCVWTLCLLSCSSVSRCFTFWSEAADIIQGCFQIRTVLNPSTFKQLENVSLLMLSVLPGVISTFSLFCQRDIKEFFNIFFLFHRKSIKQLCFALNSIFSVQRSQEKELRLRIIRLFHHIIQKCLQELSNQKIETTNSGPTKRLMSSVIFSKRYGQ